MAELRGIQRPAPKVYTGSKREHEIRSVKDWLEVPTLLKRQRDGIIAP